MTGAWKNGSLNPDGCNRKFRIFNGRERFDVVLSYLRQTNVTRTTRRGYSGPGIVCRARYVPVAGHRTDKDEIEYVANLNNLEAVLVPMPDSDLLIPWRVVFPTPLGNAVVQQGNIVTSGALPVPCIGPLNPVPTVRPAGPTVLSIRARRRAPTGRAPCRPQR